MNNMSTIILHNPYYPIGGTIAPSANLSHIGRSWAELFGRFPYWILMRAYIGKRIFLCIPVCISLVISGCVSPALFAATEIAPRAINGKGLAEDGADLVTGKDCRLIEGTIHEKRKICEHKGSAQTKNDFKGFLNK